MVSARQVNGTDTRALVSRFAREKAMAYSCTDKYQGEQPAGRPRPRVAATRREGIAHVAATIRSVCNAGSPPTKQLHGLHEQPSALVSLPIQAVGE